MTIKEIQSHEIIKPHQIGIATTTFYPGFPDEEVSRVRGNLALKPIQVAVSKRYQIVVVDGSNAAFKRELEKTGAIILEEKEKRMSAGRRQAFEAASGLEGVYYLNWGEPEKHTYFRDCLEDAVRPVALGQACISSPRRTSEAFTTYPAYQAVFEQRANEVWNYFLRRKGLWPKDAPDQDPWFGPRVIKNDPKILKYFLEVYKFNPRQNELGKPINDLHAVINPEAWPNATFLPLVAALADGITIAVPEVNYRHPEEQTRIEIDSDEFRRKRDVQYRGILGSMLHFVALMDNDSRTRMFKATGNTSLEL